MTDIIEAVHQREKLLLEQLAVAPIVELTALVDFVGGGHSAGNDYWTLRIEVLGWRVGGGALRTEDLWIWRKVMQDEIEEYRKTIHCNSVIKVRTRFAEENAFGRPQAMLEEVLQLDVADVELHEHLVQLQHPVTYEDAKFGLVTFDRRVKMFDATAQWQRKKIELRLCVDNPDNIAASLQVAYALWEKTADWQMRIRDYAVQQLLPLKNASWRENGEAEVTAAEFEKHMNLESIIVRSDGSFEFWHDDGDLFWGHAILVAGNLAEGPTRADIPG